MKRLARPYHGIPDFCSKLDRNEVEERLRRGNGCQRRLFRISRPSWPAIVRRGITEQLAWSCRRGLNSRPLPYQQRGSEPHETHWGNVLDGLAFFAAVSKSTVQSRRVSRCSRT